MFLYLDSNIVVSNPLLKGPTWEAVADAVVNDFMDLYVSQLTVDEAVARYQTSARARERALDKTVRAWPADSRRLLRDAIGASKTFSENYEAALLERLEIIGATVLPYPEGGHENIAARALSRTAPFDRDGNGYRDTLHWMTFLELLDEDPPHDASAILLSADKRAFGQTAQAHLDRELREIGVEWEVEFLHDITAFAVPGQFTDEAGHIDPTHQAQICSSLEQAILHGGTPYDFTHHLARITGFNEAKITRVLSMDFATDNVRIERRTGDLWVTFSAKVTCESDLETIEVFGEEVGEYTVVRDYTTWALEFEGNAISTNRNFNDVAALRLTSVDGAEDFASQHLAH